MKYVRVSLKDVERATKGLNDVKTHIENCAQRIIKNDLENAQHEKERRNSIKEFKFREKTLKDIKDKLHRQTMELRSGHNWTEFEDDNLRQSLVDFLELKAIQYGRTSWAIQLRIRNKITSPGCSCHQETVCGDRHYKV